MEAKSLDTLKRCIKLCNGVSRTLQDAANLPLKTTISVFFETDCPKGLMLTIVRVLRSYLMPPTVIV